MTTFSNEHITIPPNVHQYFEEHVVPLMDKMCGYKLAVSGPISAGKSTLLQILFNLFNEYKFKAGVLPEYINSDPHIGSELLGRFITKKITNATFQNYILDVYKESYNNLKSGGHNVIMMERVPDDSILIFANITNCNTPEDLNEQTLFALYCKMLEYDKSCDFPSYIDSTTELIDFTGSVEDILIAVMDTIIHDITTGVKKRIIGLRADINVCVSRIKRRGRNEEQDYDRNYLQQIIHAYDEIFKIKRLNAAAKSAAQSEQEHTQIDRKYNIRFTNIGKLIDDY